MTEEQIVEKVAQEISRSFREEGKFWDGEWESDTERDVFHESAARAIGAYKEALAEAGL